MLFGKKKNREQEASVDQQNNRQGISNGAENPFLKPGDIIRLRSKDGKYQVASTDHDGFTVYHYPVKQSGSGPTPIRCQWEDFRHWSRQ